MDKIGVGYALVTDLEKKIDNIVYTIYGLNDADIKVIEKA